MQITIWRYIRDKDTWYSVTLSRSYKQGDETWKEAYSLGFGDTLIIAKLLNQAHSWIVSQIQADATARKGHKEDADSSDE